MTKERQRSYQARRRAITSGAHADAVDWVSVFDRDGWLCQLCEEPIDAMRRWPDEGSASLDHIVPLSKGGSHTYGNV